MGHRKEGPTSFFGVINHPKREKATKGDFGAFQDILTKSYGYKFLFASIVHDRDILEDGTLKTIHMHLFLAVREGDYEKSQIIEMLSKDFGIPSECIQMEEAGDNGACVRYLLHKDQKWKTQYLASEIKSNDFKALTPLMLNDFEAIEQATNLQQLTDWRGLPFVARYKSLIEAIKQEGPRERLNKQLLALYEAYFFKVSALLKGGAVNYEKLLAEIEDLEDKIDRLRTGRNQLDFLKDN